jgi:hypothetical protein
MEMQRNSGLQQFAEELISKNNAASASFMAPESQTVEVP